MAGGDDWDQINRLWDLRPKEHKLLRDGLNRVFKSYTRRGEPVIIRVTDDRHRTGQCILGELSFLKYLAEHGRHVPHPKTASGGSLLESLPEDAGGLPTHVVCFAFLEGEAPDPTDPAVWSTPLIKDIGRELGRIHTLSKRFEPPSNLQRYPWYEETEFQNLHCYRGHIPDDVLSSIRQHVERLKDTTRDDHSYGLIHGDVYANNVLIESGHSNVKFFDFDQACYGWYAYDLICPLFAHYLNPIAKIPTSNQTDGLTFLGSLLAGYREYCEATPEQLALAPALLRLKLMFVYLMACRRAEHWAKALHEPVGELKKGLGEMEQMILSGDPLIDIDFKAL